MVSPRWRKVLRDLWGYKTRTILIVLSIAIGVFAVGTIASTQVILSRDLAAGYLATNPANAVVFTEPFDDELVRAIRSMPEVGDAEGRRGVTLRARVGSEEWRTIQLLAIPDYNNLRINRIEPEGGAWPPSKGELLLERASWTVIPANIGDSIEMELPNSKPRELRMAGTVHDLNQAPAFFSGLAYGYISFETLELLGLPRDYNQLDIVVRGGVVDRTQAVQVADLVRNKVEKGGRTVHYTFVPEPGKHPIENSVQTFLYLLGAIGLLSVLLSGFLVVNTISAFLTEQIRQVGIMKAIGARTGQIMNMYVCMVIAYGLMALAIAVPLGSLAAFLVSSYVATLVNFDVTSYSVPWYVFAFEVDVGILVPILASLYPIASGARITVREALARGREGGSGFGQSLIDRLVERVRGLSRPMLLSLRNTFRRKGRLALTLATLTLGGAIFIGVFSVRESALLTLDDSFRYFKYDVEVRFPRSFRTERIERIAMGVPGVSRVESLGARMARRLHRDATESAEFLVLAVPARTDLIQPTIIEGRWLMPEDENAVVINTALLKDERDLVVGNEIVLKIETRESRWRIVGMVRGVGTGPIAYANYAYFSRVVRDPGQASTAWVVGSRHDAGFQRELAGALERQFQGVGMEVSGVDTTAWTRSLSETQFNVIVVFLLIMAILLALVGGLGLMGTMSLNVIERTREIGVMRALGASSGAIQRIVITEGIIVGLISWSTGALIAIPLSQLLSDEVGMAFMQAPLSYKFSSNGALLWLAIIIILSTLASLLPAWNGSRLRVREVLAYE